jgi:HAD superfamily hydrolase (TIGR01509 family)
MCKKDEIIKILSNFNYSNKIQTIFEQLKADGFSLSCASNNDRIVLELVLKNLQIYDLLDSIISKEDVASPKPAADCYLQTMKNLRSLSSTEVLIFEDSDIGIKAAKASGAKVAIVSHPNILTYDFIINAINNSTYP